MKKSLFWTSIVFALVGWIMYFIDKGINVPTTDASTIGIIAGILGIFGMVLSLTD